MSGALEPSQPAPGRAPLIAAGVATAAVAAALSRLPAVGLLLACAAVAAFLVAAAVPGAVAGALLALVVLQDWLQELAVPVAGYGDEALLLAGLGGVAVRALRRGHFGRTPVDLPAALFAVLAAVSATVHGVSTGVAALGLLAVWKGPLAYELYARLPVEPDRWLCWLRRLLWLVAALAGLGVAQRLGGAAVFAWTGRAAYYLDWHGTKAPSLFMNHNALGHVCVLGGLLAAGLALAGPARGRKACGVAGLACLAGLVVSASRESWLAAALALAAGAALTRSRRLSGVALAASVAIAVGAVAVYYGSDVLREEIARRGAGVFEGWRLYRLGFDDLAYRGEYRVYVILKSWRVYLDHFWLGTGPGRFGGQVALVHGTPIYEQYAFLPLRGQYHPLDVFWSRLLAESGSLGALAYGWAWLAALRGLAQATTSRLEAARGLAVGGVMAWVAASVLAVFAPALEDPLVALPVWGWAGAVWRLERHGRAVEAAEPDAS